MPLENQTSSHLKNEYTCGSLESLQSHKTTINFLKLSCLAPQKMSKYQIQYCPDIFCPLGLGKTVVEGVNTVVKAITDKTNTVTNALKPHSHPTIYRHPTKVGHYKRNSIAGI